jgi:AAA domain/Protein of unknown function (DUF2726)
VVDPRVMAILIRDRATDQFADKTRDILRIRPVGQQFEIVFTSNKCYPYNQDRVLILRHPRRRVLAQDERVEADGIVWSNSTEVVTFAGPDGEWAHVFYRTRTGEKCSSYRAHQVRIMTSADVAPAVADVLNYWHSVADGLPSGDPLRRGYDTLDFVHPESVLSAFLSGSPIESRTLDISPIFPFRCNLSQRTAVERALTSSMSIIEGPPGTGKTETILNLIANIVAVQHKTVGIVSFGNTAVDNVRDKLDELGFAHMIGNLGRKEKRDAFFAGQEARNNRVAQLLSRPLERPDLGQLADLDQRLRGLQSAERTRAERRQELDAYRLELRHFDGHLQRDELPDLTGLPLLRRSADRVLDYLAESEVELAGLSPGPLRRLRNYFRYGSVRALDPADTSVVLGLQRAYYEKRIAELERSVERLDRELERADFDELCRQHQKLSVHFLSAELAIRYQEFSGTRYKASSYRLGTTFSAFLQDYPALLSTCHSLRASIADGHLLDYLIIDEASQVNLPLAGLAMSCARNVVVVGDQRQLPPIPIEAAAGLGPPPKPGYDCQRNLLAALSDLYGAGLPSTLLCEHYRCDPAIIGFCNKKFYGGELIPYTSSGAERPVIVVRTVEGNHMRQHREGGRSNQREIDVIVEEVIPRYCTGIPESDIGIIAPYRHQADKVAHVLDRMQADTVHKFQGRQQRVMILSTVLDESWRGRTGLPFVDDPQLVNVAVSRAIARFILVTNSDMLPRSRHIRDLVGYIRYQHPGEDVDESSVISVFDLLYRDYSRRLEPLAARLRRERRYPSEDIIWTVLLEILAEPRYAHLTARCQMLLRDLLPRDLARLTPRQRDYVGNRASVDFVVYNRVTNQPVLAIEVDGFAFHENKPDQLERDELKDQILHAYQLLLLRLRTTGSDEPRRIRRHLDAAEAQWARQSAAT